MDPIGVPPDSAPIEDANPATVIPVGLRIASVLCWVAGVVTILLTLATDVPTLSGPEPEWGSLVLAFLIGLAVCWAGFMIRKQRKIGVLVLVLAWATPKALLLMIGETPPGGPITVVIALILVAMNWKHMQ